ncbi:YcbK family protein [Aminobacterium colombiense]|uniref:Peptidase M15A n=1 Tax=Aminobacterium colombiense (strain DSM 12261 / ALA-1) TaxID=572547 RepID=D5EF92_AMICL|nr:D-Ala-D-Ala carboxypeptidase family metallohydrolase [Aminobacterium colombiense]ADE57224.1 Peptidase M15A [Aminobacterium colombiense DSM 12261]
MLSEHFSRTELACRCGCDRCDIKPKLLSLLEKIRSLVGTPIFINSGYRCPTHNKRIGGVPNSWHTQGVAADIRQAKYSNNVFHSKVLRAYKDGKLSELGGLGLYNGRIHVDVHKPKDGHLRQWRG